MSVIIDSINENVLLTTFKAKIKSDYHKKKCVPDYLSDINRNAIPLITLPCDIRGEYRGITGTVTVDLKIEGEPVFSLPLKALKYKSKGTFTTLYFNTQDLVLMYFNSLVMNTYFNGTYLTYDNITSVLNFDSSSKIKFSFFPKELETEGVPIFTLNENKREVTPHFLNSNTKKIGNGKPLPISLGSSNLIKELFKFNHILKTNSNAVEESHHNISNNMKSILLNTYRDNISHNVITRVGHALFN